MSVPIVVMASGRGSNFEAIHHAIEAGKLGARIAAVVSDQPNAPVLEKAKAWGLTAVYVPMPPKNTIANPTEHASARRFVHEERVLEAIAPFAARFLVMAGYMRIVTPKLIEAFRSERGYTRIVNIHPSLLPAFPGVGAYSQAFDYGSRVSGVTVHLVETDVDGGPICAQEAFSLDGCKDVHEVEARGLEIEHRLYPETLQWVLPERFETHTREGRLCVRPS